MKLSRSMTRFGLVVAALALMISMALAVAGSARADQLLPIAFGEDGPRYAESSDMQNLAPPVASLRGYDLDSQYALDNGSADPASSLIENDFALLLVGLVILVGLIALSRFIGSRVVQHKGVGNLSSWKGQAPETLG